MKSFKSEYESNNDSLNTIFKSELKIINNKVIDNVNEITQFTYIKHYAAMLIITLIYLVIVISLWIFVRSLLSQLGHLLIKSIHNPTNYNNNKRITMSELSEVEKYYKVNFSIADLGGYILASLPAVILSLIPIIRELIASYSKSK